MNKGDRVKLSKTTETGTITNILKGDQVEVSLDGWNSVQVFSKNDLKLIEITIASAVPAPSKIENDYEKGIFIAFVPIKLPIGECQELYLINNTAWDLPFSLTIDKTRSKIGLMAGFMPSVSYKKHAERLKMENFEDWKNITFSAIYYKNTSFEAKAMLYSQKKFLAQTFFQNKKKLPLIDIEGYLFKLDEPSLTIDPKVLKEKMMEKENPIVPQKNISKNALEVDLHIENLSKTYWRLSDIEIFELQIKTFEQELDQAIAKGLDEIVFIHGIGEGKLKAALHQKLNGHRNINYFENASANIYGTGATFVSIK